MVLELLSGYFYHSMNDIKTSVLALDYEIEKTL